MGGIDEKSPSVEARAFDVKYRRAKFYFLPRISFFLSPGLNSEAPLDSPVVEESFFLSPGENSEAPRAGGVVELFNWVPGAKLEAPLPEPAKLRPDEAISMTAAVTIKVF